MNQEIVRRGKKKERKRGKQSDRQTETKGAK
jgi:hypothetical protein